MGGCSHDHQKEWAIYEKSTDEKIKAADRFREEGNEAYRKHNYGLAAVHYRKALLQFDYTFPEGDEEEKRMEAVKVPCLLNLAACKCQQEDWDEVLTHCRLALEINPRLVKAYYRIGLAHLARDNFDEAKDALMTAHEIEPKNNDVLGALKRLKENIDNYKVRQKEVFREMVVGAAGQGDDQDAVGGDTAAETNQPSIGGHNPEQRDQSSANPDVSDTPACSASLSSVDAEGAMASTTPASRLFDGAGVSAQMQNEVPEGGSFDSGLRQRRRSEEKSHNVCNEDLREVDFISPSERKILNGVLLGAGILGTVAVGVCATAFLLMPQGSN